MQISLLTNKTHKVTLMYFDKVSAQYFSVFSYDVFTSIIFILTSELLKLTI